MACADMRRRIAVRKLVCLALGDGSITLYLFAR